MIFCHFPIKIPIKVEKITFMGRKGPRAKTKTVLKSVSKWQQFGSMPNLKFQTFLNKNHPRGQSKRGWRQSGGWRRVREQPGTGSGGWRGWQRGGVWRDRWFQAWRMHWSLSWCVPIVRLGSGRDRSTSALRVTWLAHLANKQTAEPARILSTEEIRHLKGSEIFLFE